MIPLLGWLGFALVQVFYVPQVIKIVRTRDVSGLSLSAWVILWLGLFFYLIYSVFQRDPVFIAGNAIGVVQSSLMIGLLLKYRR